MTTPTPAMEFVDEGIGRCSPTVEAAIYFCATEAVQNATKHAGSHARVTITLGRDQQRAHFVVADDGVGMDNPWAADGNGLTSMRDRIGAVSGELEFTSLPGHGTTVRGSVPLERTEGRSRDNIIGATVVTKTAHSFRLLRTGCSVRGTAYARSSSLHQDFSRALHVSSAGDSGALPPAVGGN